METKKALLIVITIVLVLCISAFLYVMFNDDVERQGSIRYVDISHDWKDTGAMSFSAKRAYLVPDIEGIGDWKHNYLIGEKNVFFVVETDIRNEKTSGNRTIIDTSNYFRILDLEGKKVAPSTVSTLYLSPKEDGTQFIIFVVDKNTQKLDLLSGNLGDPKTTHIDFFGDNVTVSNGVFFLKQGLVES